MELEWVLWFMILLRIDLGKSGLKLLRHDGLGFLSGENRLLERGHSLIINLLESWVQVGVFYSVGEMNIFESTTLVNFTNNLIETLVWIYFADFFRSRKHFARVNMISWRWGRFWIGFQLRGFSGNKFFMWNTTVGFSATDFDLISLIIFDKLAGLFGKVILSVITVFRIRLGIITQSLLGKWKTKTWLSEYIWMKFTSWFDNSLLFQFDKVFLCMRTDLCSASCFNIVFYFFPIFTVHFQTFFEFYLFFYSPSSCYRWW